MFPNNRLQSYQKCYQVIHLKVEEKIQILISFGQTESVKSNFRKYTQVYYDHE